MPENEPIVPKFYIPKSDEVVRHEETLAANDAAKEIDESIGNIDDILRNNGIID